MIINDREVMVETAQAFIESDDPHSENSPYSQMVRENLALREARLKEKMKAAREAD